MRTIPELEEGTHKALASGTLPDGSPVIVNADGTVSVAAVIPPGVGNPVIFRSETNNYAATTYDSNANRVVIAFADLDNSGYGTAIVGTVSGTLITFGSVVVFSTHVTRNITATFDSNSNKVVIAYVDPTISGNGKAIVGTVDGNNLTSISFGTAVVFESNNITDPYLSATFDSNENKVVIAYTDVGNSNYGTAIVGNVSGTSITFGTAVVFTSSNSQYAATTFDSNSNQVIIVTYNGTLNGEGRTFVGSVNGTSISFGSANVFNTQSTTSFDVTFALYSNKTVIAYRNNITGKSYAIVGSVDVSSTLMSFGTPVEFTTSTIEYRSSISFDTIHNKVVISYTDTGNSNYGTVVVGTLIGNNLNDISFGTPTTFNAISTYNIVSTFDSDTNQVVIVYNQNTNDTYGAAVAFSAGPGTTLTTDNYIGTSKGGTYASGSRATIDVKGSLSTNQSGLTAGQSYFVQTDGTLSDTAGTPSVFAGTAVSATSLLVKT